MSFTRFHAGLCAALALTLAPALAQDKVKDKPPAQVTFFDSRLFDSSLSKDLDGDAVTVEVAVNGKISLNKIPERMDQWLSTVGENGELTLKQTEPQLKPKFIGALAPIVIAMIKQMSKERMLEPAKKYNATIQYVVDRNGESSIEKIVFTRKK
jgi:hypothetical protein